MDKLIDSCLPAGKRDVQQHPADLQPPDLPRLCREAAVGQIGMAEVRGIHFVQEAADDAHIRGEALRLRQIVINLLHSTVRHTAPDGRVPVTLRSEEETTSGCSNGNARRIRPGVTNTHPPLPSEVLQRIFEPFYRAGSTDGADGARFSLDLVQRIVAPHGGEVAAANAERAGESLFQISVGLSVPPQNPAATT